MVSGFCEASLRKSIAQVHSLYCLRSSHLNCFHQIELNQFSTFSASQPRYRISRLPAMLWRPACSRSSLMTLLVRFVMAVCMRVNQVWAEAVSVCLMTIVCLASEECSSICLKHNKKEREYSSASILI